MRVKNLSKSYDDCEFVIVDGITAGSEAVLELLRVLTSIYPLSLLLRFGNRSSTRFCSR